MRKLAKLQVVRIALLTEDTDFIDLILDLQAKGTNILVLIPGNLFSTVQKYQRKGVKVLQLEMSTEGPLSRVRAILHPDGLGSVKLSTPYEPVPTTVYRQAQDAVGKFLHKLGYGDECEGYMIQKSSKFWFANQLGCLTVFPYQPSVMNVLNIVVESSKTRTWEAYSGSLAYFLPITGRGRMTTQEKEKYGYARARGVFRGGGPFILDNSSDLAVSALRRLGFLDDRLNSDVPEAMFLFVNLTENKKPLRKLELLPRPGENHSDVGRKLRLAFLSHATPGTWQVMNNSSAVMQPILRILKRASVISAGSDSGYDKQETFEAMKHLARQQQLPAMRTFNGLAWRLLRHNSRDPSRRSVVEFER
eukprot:Skav231741  [mRNA]  locus=scaffold638:238582:239667:- [translate_table: standard]